MDSRQEIKDLIPEVYNIRFGQTLKDCINEVCTLGKCICMDSEQAGLLQGILLKEDFIGMEIRGGRCLFRNLQQGDGQKQRCLQAAEGKGLPDWFIPHRNRIDREQLDAMILQLGRSRRTDFADMLGSVPAVYMINSSRELDKRESLINLCVYTSCPQRYLDQLLRAVICYTVGCYKKADPSEWGTYTQKVAEIFRRLNSLFEHSRERMEELLEVVDAYMVELGQGGSGLRLAQNTLSECRERMQAASDIRIRICEGDKSRQWYRILKKIFQIMGMPVKEFPELTFVDFQRQPSDYDDIIRILDDVKADRVKACKVLEIIQNVFYNGQDITEEEVIQELQRIAEA